MVRVRRLKVFLVIGVALAGLFGGMWVWLSMVHASVRPFSAMSLYVDADNSVRPTVQSRFPLFSVIAGSGGAREVDWKDVPSSAKAVLNVACITVTPNMDGVLNELQFTARRTVTRAGIVTDSATLGTDATTKTTMADLGLPRNLKENTPTTLILKLRDLSVPGLDLSTGEVVRDGFLTPTYLPWANMEPGTYNLTTTFRLTKVVWTPVGKPEERQAVDFQAIAQHTVAVRAPMSSAGKLTVRTLGPSRETVLGPFSVRYVVPAAGDWLGKSEAERTFTTATCRYEYQVYLPIGTTGTVTFADEGSFKAPNPQTFTVGADTVLTGQYVWGATPPSGELQATVRCNGLVQVSSPEQLGVRTVNPQTGLAGLWYYDEGSWREYTGSKPWMKLEWEISVRAGTYPQLAWLWIVPPGVPVSSDSPNVFLFNPIIASSEPMKFYSENFGPGSYKAILRVRTGSEPIGISQGGYAVTATYDSPHSLSLMALVNFLTKTPSLGL